MRLPLLALSACLLILPACRDRSSSASEASRDADARAASQTPAAASSAAAPAPAQARTPAATPPETAASAASAGGAQQPAAAQTSGAPVLGIQGDRFTIDNRPAFLTLVSYFDALDATDDVLREDFAYFQQHGIQGVRIFPNWWDCTAFTNCRTPSPRTLMDSTGALRPGPLERLHRVLDLAARHRLIVDLSFARETVQDEGRRLSGAGYEAGLVEVTRVLAGRAPHVLFDLQNEIEIHGLGDARDTAAEVARVRARLREVDPARLVTASTGSLDLSKRLASSLDLLAYHDPRHRDWWSRTAGEVAALRAMTPRPIYFQEPIAYQIAEARPGRDDTELAHFLDARRAAREAGAAAWLFHTRKGFWLDQQSFVRQEEPGDRGFFEAVKSGK